MTAAVRNLHHEPAHLRYQVQPRMVSPDKAARRLGLTPAEFREKLPKLISIGMPQACPVTGNFDLAAIDAWLDRRSGLAKSKPVARDASDTFEERLARLG